ncbi:5'-Nucleotidase/apyrase family protein [Rhodotorula toruloides]|uniref:5'-Nucleotidase/apyrase family protein n=1 Tax=Rhodotorula toruloides TaxID=5286 RepID=A0A511KR99_RHOTO|nr:5'-Nucleotidase/apyrase family protein [Rhodotorula toruloides]
MPTLVLALVTLALALALACSAIQPPQLTFARDDPLGARTAQQPDAHPPTHAHWPYRPLPWGELNILATTDTHGWLLGHLRNEPSFSGDWGDFYSFVKRMKDEARRRGVDLLLVDSGDRVDGNGLVDAELPPRPKGSTALEIFSRMPYDIITTGNHELYKYPVASYVSSALARAYGEKWVVSNVNITVGGEGETVMGNRVRKFVTERGRRVTAIAPLFDFKAHAPGITVQPPSAMIHEPWFLDAISSAPDFFLLVGHMSLRTEPDSEWSLLLSSIRDAHPTIPVLVFGGHHHIRDCVQEDAWMMGLAAGRYFETVGFMSVSGLNGETKPPVFRRRYLDQNRHTYAYHTTEDFDTPEGRAISNELTATARWFNLTDRFGIAPQDYYLYRYPPHSPHSIFHLLTTKVLPLLIRRPDRPHEPYTLLNTGSVRFDLLKGNFTRGDQWIMLPFTNSFLYIPAVPLALASRVLHYLNVVGEHGLVSSSTSSSPHPLAGPDARAAADSAALEHAHRRSLVAQAQSTSFDHESDGKWRLKRRTEGYVTPDSCGLADSDPSEAFGDDTLHRPFRSSLQPIFVSTALPSPSHTEEDKVDVVFFDFITPDVLNALNVLGGAGKGGKRYESKDVEVYMRNLTANTLMEEYAKREWN